MDSNLQLNKKKGKKHKMSALAPVLVYSDGLANRVAIYRVLSTNTGDTADVGTEFKKIIST